MKERGITLAARFSALCGYWAWALLATPDFQLVLDRRVRLPLIGADLACAIFFIAAPLAAIAAFLANRFRRPIRWPILVAFPAALILNAFRCLKLHDPVLSYVTAGLAVAGTGLAASSWLASRPFRKAGASVPNLLVSVCLSVSTGVEALLVLFLVPWALRGDLPGMMNNYPFGPDLRSVLYANLAGYERPTGGGLRSLRGIRLEGANLRGAGLKGVDLRNARLFRARLDKADLEGADLRAAGLVEVRLSFIDLRRADLTGADLSGAYSMGGDLRNAVFRSSGAHAQSFINADARGADFSSAELSKAWFFGSDLRGADFRNVRLPDANLIRARFDGADLTGASFARADLFQAVLRGAVLENSDLSGALHLAPDGLAEAATLRGAALDAPLLDEMKRRSPGLF